MLFFIQIGDSGTVLDTGDTVQFGHILGASIKEGEVASRIDNEFIYRVNCHRRLLFSGTTGRDGTAERDDSSRPVVSLSSRLIHFFSC